MKSQKRLGLGILFLVIMTIPVTAMAWRGGSGHQMRHWDRRIMGLKGVLELNLSASQQEELIKIISKYEEEREGILKTSLEAKKHLAVLVEDGEFSEAEIRKGFQEASKVEEDLFVLKIRTIKEIKQVLTPEQIAQLKDRRGRKMERMKARFDPLCDTGRE